MQGKREKRGGGRVSTDIIRCNRIARREKINPQQTRWKFAGKIITRTFQCPWKTSPFREPSK